MVHPPLIQPVLKAPPSPMQEVQEQPPARSQAARSRSETRRRKRMIREQLVLAGLPSKGAAFDAIWRSFAYRRGGFTTAEVTRAIRDHRVARHEAFPKVVSVAAAAAATRARNGNPDPISSDEEDDDEEMPAAPAPAPAPVQVRPVEDEPPWTPRLRGAIPIPRAAPPPPGQPMSDSDSSDEETDREWAAAHLGAGSGDFRSMVQDFFAGDLPKSRGVFSIAEDRSVDRMDRVMRISNLTTPLIAAKLAEEWFNDVAVASMLRESHENAERQKVEMERRPECPICMDRVDKMYQVTYTCEHTCCWSCIKNHTTVTLNSNGDVVRCPMCPKVVAVALGRYYPETACIPPQAIGLIDPLLFKLAAAENPIKRDQPDPVVPRFARSRQMEAFLQGSKDVDKMSMCPKCNAWSRGCVGDSVARCSSATCAMLYCVLCKESVHIGRTCDEASGAARAKEDSVSKAYLKKVSKPCPRCAAPITHYKGHGCHHMTCPNPSCRHQFCWVCLSKWVVDGGNTACRCVLSCTGQCGCLPCDECTPGRHCNACTGNCPVCLGITAPGKY